MKIITTRELRNETKSYFELAEKERIVVKRGRKYVSFLVSDDPDTQFFSGDWIKEFLAIPAEHRCNPFDISESGDLFWADKRNIKQLENRVKDSKTSGMVQVSSGEDLKSFLDSL